MPDTTTLAGATASALSQAASTANGQPAAATSNRLISSDFQTFLKMMTAQMRNQDPLNPVDSSDYAVQLATFSSVEQQVLTNDLLNAMIGKLASAGISEIAGWIGMDARTAAPAHFDGTTPITLSPLPAVLADEAWLVVRDTTGTEVDRRAIGLTGADVTWDGTDGSGNALPAGIYGFEVENLSGGELLGATPVEHYARVTEAQSINGQRILLLEGGVQIFPADVIALRDRPAPASGGA